MATPQEISAFKEMVKGGYKPEKARELIKKAREEIAQTPTIETPTAEAEEEPKTETSFDSSKLTLGSLGDAAIKSAGDIKESFSTVGKGIVKTAEAGAEAIGTLGEQFVKKPVDALIDKIAGRDFDPSNKFTADDVADTLGATVTTGFNIAAPGSMTALGIASETPFAKELLEVASKGITNIGEFTNKLPVLSTLRDNMSEEKKKEFDSTIGTVATAGALKGLGKLKKTPTKKVAELKKQATQGVEEFIKPTKESTKTITKKITPELLKKELKGSREQLKELAETKIKETGQKIDNFIKEGKIKGELPINNLIDKLIKEDAKLRVDGKVLPGNEAHIDFINKQVDFLSELKKTYGKNLPANKQVELRRSYDTVFDKTVTRDKIVKFQDDIKVKLADGIRNELSKNNPEFANLNKEYSFYKGLDNVLGETIRRTTGQPVEGLLSKMGKSRAEQIGVGAGASLGATIGGTPGAAIGGLLGGTLGGKISKIMSDPKFKLISANKKNALADAISSGKKTNIEKATATINTAIKINALNKKNNTK